MTLNKGCRLFVLWRKNLKLIIAIFKALFKVSETTVVMAGLSLLFIALVAGVAGIHLTLFAGDAPNSVGNLDRLTSGNMPYYLTGIILIYIVGIFVSVGLSIRKFFIEFNAKRKQKATEIGAKSENFWVDLFKTFLKS